MENRLITGRMSHNGAMPNPGFEERRGDSAPPPRNRPAGGAERVSGSGRTIAGRYRLDRVLGKGSMGTVWAAYDETLHRRVAIKEIYFPAGTPAAEASMLIERTLREARAIAQLSHPNVITLYDILTLPTGPVIVMEVLAARSLGEVLKEVGPLTTGQAATVGLAVAAGLSAAHAAGITHRDVKPGNVLIGGDGRIKLTDFGIARSASENPMTATGLLLGSPAYIAPEVASGATAGPGADAWGLGALLFACVEGKPPFDKGSPVATLMSVVNDPVPALQRAGSLAPVVKGLLVKDPAHRLNLRQARGALRPLADDPVETRLVFNTAPSSELSRPGTLPPRVGGSQLPGAAPRGATQASPGAARPPAGATPPIGPARPPVGATQPPAGPARPPAGAAQPPTVAFRPSWVDEAPPRPGVTPPRPGVNPTRRIDVEGFGGQGFGGQGFGAEGFGAEAFSAAAARPGSPGVPPPPWAGSGASELAPLPVSGSSPAATQVGPSVVARRWIAIVVFVAAAAVAFFGIRAIAQTVNSGQSQLAATAASATPTGSLGFDE
jgi:serine/threonine protein kinase